MQTIIYFFVTSLEIVFKTKNSVPLSVLFCYVLLCSKCTLRYGNDVHVFAFFLGKLNIGLYKT